ncbi:hypothetical protein D9M69_543920 [compost metagenome]
MRVALPGQLVGVFKRLAGRGQGGGHPVGDDVVVGFVGCGQLHQFHAAGAPVAQRPDPGAGAAFVAGFHVFVAGEVAVALHQAEAARLLHGERTHHQLARVLQRAPQPLAVPGDHHQAVRVVDFRAEVGDAALVLAKEEHAGQRCQTECVHRRRPRAQVDPGVHGDGGLGTRVQHAPVGAGAAWRFQQGVDRDLLRVRRRAF